MKQLWQSTFFPISFNLIWDWRRGELQKVQVLEELTVRESISIEGVACVGGASNGEVSKVVFVNSCENNKN